MIDRRERIASPEESLQMALDSHRASLWTAMPAIVVDVDLAAMTLTAQPTIQVSITDEKGQVKSVNMPLLIHVPIVFPSAGGFTLTLPISAGDEVLVVFASRCIDAWWQSGGIGRPMEARMHDLSDGFAIPGPRSQPRKVAAISSTNAQLRTDGGDTYVEITPGGKINLVATQEVTVTAPVAKVTASDHTTITSPEINLEGNVFITGTLNQGTESGGDATFNGNVHVDGAVTATVNVTGGGISLNSHHHTGVYPGSGNTGGPA